MVGNLAQNLVIKHARKADGHPLGLLCLFGFNRSLVARVIDSHTLVKSLQGSPIHRFKTARAPSNRDVHSGKTDPPGRLGPKTGTMLIV
jgi:hypothetical protein